MKQIVLITVLLAVVTFAIFGCLYIFEFLSYEAALTNLAKVVAAIVLIGACSALIALLMAGNKKPPE